MIYLFTTFKVKSKGQIEGGKMLVPKLRFKEFNNNWNNEKISNAFALSSGSTPNTKQRFFYTGNINWVSSGELKRKYIVDTINKVSNIAIEKNNLKIYDIGTLLIAIYGLEASGVRGTCSILNIKATISQACMALESKNNISNEFMYYWYQKNGQWIGLRIAQGTKQQNLTAELIGNLEVEYPSIDEQEKIVNFLSLLDKKIELQKQKIEALKIYKKGLIQKMYQKNYNNKIKMEKILIQKSIRNTNDENYNVYSVSNKDGFILQTEQFKDRIVASEDTKNYKVVEKDDFAYNPARINVGSIARMKKDTKGIISPMYICFKCNEKILPEYLEYFFESSKFTYEMNKRLEGSVRMCLSYESMLNIPIELPNKNEQEEISKMLNNLSDKIKLEEEKWIKLKKLKKGLLQKMLI